MAVTPQTPPAQPASRIVAAVTLRQQRSIGRFVVVWGRLEAALQDVISQLLRVDPTDGRLLSARLGATARIATIRALAPRRLADPAVREELAAILALAEARQPDRDAIVHGVWGSMMPGLVPAAMALRAQPGLPDRIVAEIFSEERMRAVIDDVTACLTRLNALLTAPPAPPAAETPREPPAPRHAAPASRRRAARGRDRPISEA